VHPADMQDRDGAPLVIAAIHDLFPWLRHLFADRAYAGDKLLNVLTKFGIWKIQIVRRMADAVGFEVQPRRWVVERTLAWLNRNRRLVKDFEATIASAKLGSISPLFSSSAGDWHEDEGTCAVLSRTFSGYQRGRFAIMIISSPPLG
jgi:hypothetical protein